MGKGGSGKPCVWMSSRLRLSNSAGKETAVNPCPMNSFRVRWRVCCALTGGTGNYGRCVANGGKSSCVLSAWSAKKHLPMVSYEAVMHKREQRRKSLEFFRSHELVNEDGDTLDMEDVVNASSKQTLRIAAMR